MFYASEYVTYYSSKTGEATSRSCAYETFDNITDAINHNQKRFDVMIPREIMSDYVKVRGNVSGSLVIDRYWNDPESSLHGKRMVKYVLTVTKNPPF